MLIWAFIPLLGAVLLFKRKVPKMELLITLNFGSSQFCEIETFHYLNSYKSQSCEDFQKFRRTFHLLWKFSAASTSVAGIIARVRCASVETYRACNFRGVLGERFSCERKTKRSVSTRREKNKQPPANTSDQSWRGVRETRQGANWMRPVCLIFSRERDAMAAVGVSFVYKNGVARALQVHPKAGASHCFGIIRDFTASNRFAILFGLNRLRLCGNLSLLDSLFYWFQWRNIVMTRF